jgi:hypothetical protein
MTPAVRKEVRLLCFDRIPDLLMFDDQGPEAAGDPRCYWTPGDELRVRFLDGEPGLRARVMAAAREWTEHANLRLREVDDGDAELRVTFRGAGNWSALGTEALLTGMYAPGEPTMCLGEAHGATPERLAQVARHEFGHAIGLVHEHSSPAAGIRWNKPRVIAELGGPPNYWSRRQVTRNVFQRYSASRTQYSSFDPRSVMLYPFPASWTLDGRSFAGNAELSDQDKAFVRDTYPRT